MKPDTTHGQVFRLLDLPPEIYVYVCKLAVQSDLPLLTYDAGNKQLAATEL